MAETKSTTRGNPSDSLIVLDFEAANIGGTGAAWYFVLLATRFAISQGKTLAVIGDRFWPILNGLPVKPATRQEGKVLHWQDYYKYPPVTSTKDCKTIFGRWQDLPPVEASSPRIENFAAVMQLIFQPQPDIKQEVERRIKASGFNPETDIVLHIRGTDKTQAFAGSQIEAGALELEVYLQETLACLKSQPSGTRVFLCSCDEAIRQKVPELFASSAITVIYDKSESPRPMQALRFDSGLTVAEAHDENITALKVMTIMQRARVLIGGRASYMFRVAELLRWPDPTINVKDCDRFGLPEYAEPDQLPVRPMPLKSLPQFIAPRAHDDWAKYKATLDKDGIVVIEDLLCPDIANMLAQKFEQMPEDWFVHAIRHTNESKHLAHNAPGLKSQIVMAQEYRDDGWFAYHFLRTEGRHHDTCVCAICLLLASMAHYKTLETLGKLVGKPTIKSIGETFGSIYKRDMFLSVHHDQKKGSHAFVLNLTKKWHASLGGLLHFVEPGTEHIYRTQVPTFNTMIIFKVLDSVRRDHFVSAVAGDRRRLSFTGWFWE